MKIFIFIFIFVVHSINCRERYFINEVDINKGRSVLSIAAIRNGSEYNFRVVADKKLNWVATATLIQQINSTGWGFLSVETNKYFSDEIQAYYAGVNEAILTRPLIEAHLSNNYPNYCSTPTAFCNTLKQYLTTNLISMITQSRNQGGFWKMVRLMLWQIKGLQDGYDYNFRNWSGDLTETYLLQLQNQVFGLYLLQLDGDLSELTEILNGSSYDSKILSKKIIGDGSCSAFIKYIKGEIYTAHVTWSHFQSMLRLTKFYNLPYRSIYSEKSSSIISGQNISFSSYPGLISSVDDFYITSGGLVTTETTIGNYNKSLWIPLKDQASSIVFEYIRVQTANRLSKSGKEWIQYFSIHNSGTYNNQWMIVNTNLMKGHKFGMPIPDEVLYIAEQIPGKIKSHDVTDHLRTSYWASYNIPYDQEIYNTSGFGQMAAQYGDFFSFDKAPRALIFKRDAQKVVDGESLMQLMRYNDFKNDPYGRCACNPPYSGENGISARSDLNLKNGSYPFESLGYRLHGGTDLKVTNLMFAKAMRFVGISSPTYDQQPFFDWRKINDTTVRHKMHPEVWNFEPILTPFP